MAKKSKASKIAQQIKKKKLRLTIQGIKKIANARIADTKKRSRKKH